MAGTWKMNRHVASLWTEDTVIQDPQEETAELHIPEEHPGDRHQINPEEHPRNGHQIDPEEHPGDGHQIGPEEHPRDGYQIDPEEHPGDGHQIDPEEHPRDGHQIGPEEHPRDGHQIGPEEHPRDGHQIDPGEHPRDGHQINPEEHPGDGHQIDPEEHPRDGHQIDPEEHPRDGHQIGPEEHPRDGHQIGPVEAETSGVAYEPYESEVQMPDIMRLMKTDLSEPYSIYTYRYFIHNWPQLCMLARCDGRYVGAIVCKLEVHHYNSRRGYIAMLAVDKEYRKRKIGSTLVKKSIRQMVRDGCDEVVLETEVTNQAALSLYENLGFVRDKYLHQYYLNGVDAYRLKLWLKDPLAD